MDTDHDATVHHLSDHGRPRGAAQQPGLLWRELAGQVLRSERVENGWTLQHVAARAGVSPQYLSEVERGRKDPSSEMLESICGAVGLRLVDLLSHSVHVLGAARTSIASPHVRPSGVTSMAA